MKHTFPFCSFICAICIITNIICVTSSFSQTTKGFSVAKQEEKKQEGKTYALIVGISQYKEKGIPSLQFADKDASAFQDYMLATGVDSDNIVLLLNDKATSGEFWSQINYFSDVTKAGDKLIIYFSGHGDME